MLIETKRRLSKAGIIVGALLMLSPLVGMAMTVLGLQHAFSVLVNSGVADPGMMGAAVGEVLLSTFIGIALAVAGLVLLIVCLLYNQSLPKQPPPLPPVVPLGTSLGAPGGEQDL